MFHVWVLFPGSGWNFQGTLSFEEALSLTRATLEIMQHPFPGQTALGRGIFFMPA